MTETTESATFEPHPEVLSDQPYSDDKAVSTPEELEAMIRKLDTVLTKRINDLRTDVTTFENSVTGRVTTVEGQARTLKTQTTNNAEAIRSFTDSINAVKKLGTELRQKAAGSNDRLDQLETLQGELNTALFEAIDIARDETREVGNAADEALRDAASALTGQIKASEARLNTRITSVENAPVKPHKHAVNVVVEATTSQPIPLGGKE